MAKLGKIKKPSKGKNVKSADELKVESALKSAQQWMPIADVENSVVYKKNGVMLGVLRVFPENLLLLSNREKKRRINNYAEKINGLNFPFQTFCIGRPVDLNNYLDFLQEKAKKEQNMLKKQLLKASIQSASNMAMGGEVIERRFYIIIEQNPELHAVNDLLGKLNELKSGLELAELNVRVCDYDELLDVYSLFSNPSNAYFDNVELYDFVAPILME